MVRELVIVMVAVVLVVLWVLVLVPPLLRARLRRRGDESVWAFRRQLGVIQRAGSGASSPTSRRDAGAPSFPMPLWESVADTSGQGVGADVAGPAGLTAMAASGPPVPEPSGDVARRRPPPRTAARARTLQRRRQVLVGLLAGLALTLAMGTIPVLRMVWVLSGVSALALFGYLALLIRLRNLAAERELKLAFLPSASDSGLLLRRSAN